jgi:small subunit ribosomal protein S16
MLAIRMQRTGRSGHAQFRVIVQDSRFSPTRGRVVSYLGNYNPHTKTATIDSVKAAQYLQSGAQPSDTVARLFKKEGIKLPSWVKLNDPKKRDVRNPEKRRSTAPAQPQTATVEPAADEPSGASEPAEQPSEEQPAEPQQETTEATATEEPASEEPASEEPASEEPAQEQPAADVATPEEPSEQEKPA